MVSLSYYTLQLCWRCKHTGTAITDDVLVEHGQHANTHSIDTAHNQTVEAFIFRRITTQTLSKRAQLPKRCELPNIAMRSGVRSTLLHTVRTTDPVAMLPGAPKCEHRNGSAVRAPGAIERKNAARALMRQCSAAPSSTGAVGIRF